MNQSRFNFDAPPRYSPPVEQVDESPVIVPRPYQVEAVDAVFREWEAGHTSTMVVLGTGGGKSIIFSEVMRRWVEANQ